MKNQKDPCWKDYEMIGTKKKNGKTVPNCVPKEEVAGNAVAQGGVDMNTTGRPKWKSPLDQLFRRMKQNGEAMTDKRYKKEGKTVLKKFKSWMKE